MTTQVFLYGTLCDPELFEIVAGVPLKARSASVPGYRVHWVADESFPVCLKHDGGSAEGVVVSVDDDARARLDFYELGFGYETETLRATTKDGPVPAMVYLPVTDWPLGDAWDLADWQTRFGRLTRLAAREYMGLIETHTAEDAARAFPQIRMRAASRLRAMDDPSPEALPPEMGQVSIVPRKTLQPYTDYFAIREDWLTPPRFDGTTGAEVKRACFMGGDAVTVLPYDPGAGTVLMVRQFRHGAFARGDLNPWSLEPPAGRIDPGETPEDAARRELREEAGIEAGELYLVGRYYPSPAAYSEFLFSYIARADLTARDGTIGGLDDEAEDIMSHVVPLDTALEMIPTGAVNTGPLIVSLTWLALNRHRFG